MGDFSGNAEGVDWQDIAMAGRAYADNLVGEPGISKVMHMMADEIDRLRSQYRKREVLWERCAAMTMQMYGGFYRPEYAQAVEDAARSAVQRTGVANE